VSIRETNESEPFEDSSTRVAACTLAQSPYFVTRYPKASDISSPPCLLRLLPTGAVAGWDLHPLESAAFSRRTPKAEMGKQHLDLFPAATSSLVFRCRRESPGNVAGIFVQITRNLAGDRIRAATCLEFTNVTILLAGAIKACAFGGDAGPWGSVGAPELDQLFTSRARISVPFGIESKVTARSSPTEFA
jgi:hypothetical protein